MARSSHLDETASRKTRVHEWLHRTAVLDRRTQRLTSALDQLIPSETTVLDVGCGNGEIGYAISSTGGRYVAGAETRARASCRIPFFVFDGYQLPNGTRSVDWVMFVDVLHHAEDPIRVMEDACRVARKGLIIKDHFADSALAHRILRVMDWVGNRHLGVDLQANYLSRSEWRSAWKRLDLEIDQLNETLDLYPAPVRPIFEKGLHFAARLTLS